MPESDASAPAPRANPELVGHAEAERALLTLFHSGRLPHALLLTGPRGIGKATLAFRFARFVLAQAGEFHAAHREEFDLSIPPESGVFRRVASGGHADLLTIERAYDPRRRRLRGEIVVGDAREIAAFLRLTPAEDGWRIVIVDGADEMNRPAGNALLKILEEPPQRALLLLVAHSPGRVLPTIRSRCRRLSLSPLARETVGALLARYRPDLPEGEREAAASLSAGSIGRAIELADTGGVALYRSMLALIAEPNAAKLHAFAEPLARPDSEDACRVVEELIGQFLAAFAVAAARGTPAVNEPSEGIAGEAAAMRRLGRQPEAARWADLRVEIAGNFARSRQLNLDRKQALLGAFFAIERMAG